MSGSQNRNLNLWKAMQTFCQSLKFPTPKSLDMFVLIHVVIYTFFCKLLRAENALSGGSKSFIYETNKRMLTPYTELQQSSN